MITHTTLNIKPQSTIVSEQKSFKAQSSKLNSYWIIGNIEFRASDCCLMPTQQFFSYIMARTYIEFQIYTRI
jgi:hypothetical protein